MSDSSHVWRIFVLLGLVVVAGAVFQLAMRPADFGETGPYRFGSLLEVAAQEPVHQGMEVCGECHDDILSLHDKDIHVHVQCEVCHGSGDLHVRYLMEGDESITEEQAAMPKEYTLEGCLFCHRKLVARPSTFPQIDPVEHYRFLHVTDPETRCIECHSPHEPLFLLTRVADARIHPIIHECGDCHDAVPESDFREVESHPTIFVCQDCHPDVTRDFKTRRHAFLRCTACHLFHRENESAGRIFKNGNRRFCLLCHESRPFKDPRAVPQIVSEDHLAEMAEFLDREPDEIRKDPRACLACHYDYIHDPDLTGASKQGSR